jgi:hypothetical protein
MIRAVRLLATERGTMRLAAGALGLGTAIALAVDVLHPRPETFENHPERFFEKVAASSIWLPLHMSLLLSSVLVLAGQATLTRSIEDDPARMWARFGLALAVASNALVAVWLAFDSVAMRSAAQRWVDAGPEQKDELFRIGSALERVNFALDTLWFTLFWGATFIVYGVALLLARRYPNWIGWVALVGGVGALVSSQIQLAHGLSSWTLALGGLAAALQVPVLLAIAVLLWRRAGEPTVRASGGADA